MATAAPYDERFDEKINATPLENDHRSDEEIAATIKQEGFVLGSGKDVIPMTVGIDRGEFGEGTALSTRDVYARRAQLKRGCLQTSPKLRG